MCGKRPRHGTYLVLRVVRRVARGRPKQRAHVGSHGHDVLRSAERREAVRRGQEPARERSRAHLNVEGCLHAGPAGLVGPDHLAHSAALGGGVVLAEEGLEVGGAVVLLQVLRHSLDVVGGGGLHVANVVELAERGGSDAPILLLRLEAAQEGGGPRRRLHAHAAGRGEADGWPNEVHVRRHVAGQRVAGADPVHHVPGVPVLELEVGRVHKALRHGHGDHGVDEVAVGGGAEVVLIHALALRGGSHHHVWQRVARRGGDARGAIRAWPRWSAVRAPPASAPRHGTGADRNARDPGPTLRRRGAQAHRGCFA